MVWDAHRFERTQGFDVRREIRQTLSDGLHFVIIADYPEHVGDYADQPIDFRCVRHGRELPIGCLVPAFPGPTHFITIVFLDGLLHMHQFGTLTPIRDGADFVIK